MNDLISRSALIEEINTQRRLAKTSYPKQSFVVGDTLQCIYDAPAVDAVPVVRCKDCVYRHDSCFAGVGNTFCDLKHTYFPLDGFCSYGERRNGDATG